MSDTVLLKATAMVNGEKVSVTWPVSRYSWSLPHLHGDLRLTLKHALGVEIASRLDVTFTDDGDTDE